MTCLGAHPIRLRSFLLTGVITLSACATLPGADAMNESMQGDPPWRAGRLPVPAPSAVRVLPIVFQPGPDGPAFEPSGDTGSPTARLLARMNRHVAELPGLAALSAPMPMDGAPDVRFGCRTDGAGECEPFINPTGGPPELFLGARAPTAEWSAAARDQLAAAGADALLLITLEIGQYWPHQVDFRGRKTVILGTDHRQDVPWLTTLDDPVPVLQLTAALVDREGRVARIGAEGLIARRSSLLVSAAGAQELLSDDDVSALIDARRTDLPGDPPVWEAALRDLIAGVAGLGW